MENDDGARERALQSFADLGIHQCPNPTCKNALRRKDRCQHMYCPSCHTGVCNVCGEAVTGAEKMGHHGHYRVKVNGQGGPGGEWFGFHDVCKGLINKERQAGTYTDARGFERPRGGGREIPINLIHAKMYGSAQKEPVFSGTFGQLYQYVKSKYNTAGSDFEQNIVEVRNARGEVICNSIKSEDPRKPDERLPEKPDEMVPADAVVKLFSQWDQQKYDSMFR